MEPAFIEVAVAAIPPTEIGMRTGNEESWLQMDDGVEFSVACWVASPHALNQFIVLTVSGEPEKRKGVIEDFISTYGNPNDGELSDEFHAQEQCVWVRSR